MEIFNFLGFCVGPIQSYLHLKMGLPPVLKAGSSGKQKLVNFKIKKKLKNLNIQSSFRFEKNKNLNIYSNKFKP